VSALFSSTFQGLIALLHISDAPWTNESTDIGHSANGATVNATNLVNSTDPIDNSANATEPNAADPDAANPDAADPDAADPDAADAADADILSYF
jgi:hypothetical protein